MYYYVKNNVTVTLKKLIYDAAAQILLFIKLLSSLWYFKTNLKKDVIRILFNNPGSMEADPVLINV